MTTFKLLVCCITLFLAVQLPIAAQFHPVMPEVMPQEEGRLKKAAAGQKDDIQKLRALEQLSRLYLQKPSKRKADLATAMAYAQRALRLSEQLNLIPVRDSISITLTELYGRAMDWPAVEATVQRLSGEARVTAQLIAATRYMIMERSKEAEASLRDATLQMKTVNNRELGWMLRQLSALLNMGQDTGDPEKELLEIVKEMKAASFKKLHYPYYSLTSYYYSKGLMDKALQYSQLSLKSIEATGDSAHLGDFYMAHASVVTYNDNYTQGVDYGYKLIAAYKRHSGQFYDLSSPAVFTKVTWALGKLGREQEALDVLLTAMKDYPPHHAADSAFFLSSIGHMYRSAKAFDKAEPIFLKMLDISKRINEQLLYSYYDVSQLYVESGQFNKARTYLKEVQRLNPDQMPVPMRRHLQHLLFLADSATGHFREAVNDLRALRRLDDYDVRVERDKEVHRLEVLLETEKKEHQLKAKTQQISLLNQQAMFERNVRNLVIGISVLLLVIAVLLFYQYRNKRRTSALMEQKNILITEKNVALERLVNEKEWLLKEVHHRVKNNLHTVFCLLESQASFLSSDARKAVEKSQHRIYAMSLVHQKLYLSEDIKTIDMSLFFPEFLHFLGESFEAGDRIRIRHEVEAIRISVAVAIPVALIVNEAVTNAIKYAFPGNREGEISVVFQRKEANILLVVADNGIGMPPPEETQYSSLGIELMKGLAQELQAEIEFDTSKGTTVTVMIPEHPAASSISVINTVA